MRLDDCGFFCFFVFFVLFWGFFCGEIRIFIQEFRFPYIVNLLLHCINNEIDLVYSGLGLFIMNDNEKKS